MSLPVTVRHVRRAGVAVKELKDQLATRVNKCGLCLLTAAYSTRRSSCRILSNYLSGHRRKCHRLRLGRRAGYACLRH